MRRLLVWWFLAASQLPYGGLGATTSGPFPTQAACVDAMHWLRAQQSDKARAAYPVTLLGCWETK